MGSLFSKPSFLDVCRTEGLCGKCPVGTTELSAQESKWSPINCLTEIVRNFEWVFQSEEIIHPDRRFACFPTLLLARQSPTFSHGDDLMFKVKVPAIESEKPKQEIAKRGAIRLSKTEQVADLRVVEDIEVLDDRQVSGISGSM